MQITLNNVKCNVHPSETILQVCERVKINVPKFCYHKKLKVAGNCRMCLVEVEGAPKPIASCAAPVGDNMKIHTNTPFVYKARENVLEFLLLNHPLDCKICDQGGECDLQEHSKNYGSDRGRNYYYNRRGVQNKQLGPIVKTEMTRCIHCTRCVRFVEQITGSAVLGTLTRGHYTEIGTFVKDFLKTELSGNLVDICPVGALTARPIAFQYRSWELDKVPSLDLSDAFASSINVMVRNKTINGVNTDSIIKILPRPDEESNGYWLSDRSRFAYSEGLNFNRLNSSFYFDKVSNKQLILEIDSVFYFFFYTFLNSISYNKYRLDKKINFLIFLIFKNN